MIYQITDFLLKWCEYRCEVLVIQTIPYSNILSREQVLSAQLYCLAFTLIYNEINEEMLLNEHPGQE